MAMVRVGSNGFKPDFKASVTQIQNRHNAILMGFNQLQFGDKMIDTSYFCLD